MTMSVPYPQIKSHKIRISVEWIEEKSGLVISPETIIVNTNRPFLNMHTQLAGNDYIICYNNNPNELGILFLNHWFKNSKIFTKSQILTNNYVLLLFRLYDSTGDLLKTIYLHRCMIKSIDWNLKKIEICIYFNSMEEV